MVAHIRKANTAGNKRLLQVIIIILVPIVLEVVQSARKAVDSVDATTSIIVADGRERVKLTSRGQPVISGFPVGNELDNKNGNRAEQQDVDKAALVQEELENEPDDEEYCTNHMLNSFLMALRNCPNALFADRFVSHWYRHQGATGNKKAHWF
jgi:hypothetical protein